MTNETHTKFDLSNIPSLRFWCALVGGALLLAISVENVHAENKKPTADELRFFETKIRPLLVESCVDCHSEDLAESDLRLDNLVGMLKGGKAGPAIIPGKPKSSLLITAVGYQDNTLQMPPDEKLSKAAVADLTRWVEMGAPHPESGEGTAAIKMGGIDYEEGRKHWAFRPVVSPDIPAVQNNAWIVNPIDAFVLAKLEKQQMQPVPTADKRTLLRRATYDLIGLPPTPEEIHAFLQDESPEAFAKVVDRLLDSPHYGERWGRHWLDVARYADSNGLDENVAHGNAWKYRDYVIRSLNNDKPYDQFLQEQIAGDLLDSGNDYQQRNERIIATGFLSLGPKVLAEVDSMKMEMDIIDEQLDTLGRSLMGLTFGCARCHDHKFDPIAQKDYYALAGILKSTKTMESYKIVAKWHENSVGTQAEEAKKVEHQKRIDLKKNEIKSLVSTATTALKERLAIQSKKLPKKPEDQFTAAEKETLKKLRAEQKKLESESPVLPTAMSVTEGNVSHLPIHIRGSHLTLGETVQRGFPQVIQVSTAYQIPEKQSGRLQFSKWLTNPEHPLTARVMVNRMWRWHFGKGIVPTTDNFGLQGTPPTHPLLLDWLAVKFVEQGYSLKAMHRLMMLSNTYRMSSQFEEKNAALDPDNELIWRFNGQRLEAELIRDAILAVSGNLDREMGGNLLNVKNREFVFNHESKENVNYDFTRRSIYLPVIRNHLHPIFSLFDYTDASVLNGNRQTSTLATQALFMMNSPFLEEQTELFSAWLLKQPQQTEGRVQLLYEKSYGRLPTETESARAIEFVSQFVPVWLANHTDKSQAEAERAAWKALCHATLAANEFTYIR